MIGGLFYWSQQEDKMLLFGSLDSESAQEIVAELESRGINYSLEDGGSSIYVPSDRVHELRLALAPMVVVLPMFRVMNYLIQMPLV